MACLIRVSRAAACSRLDGFINTIDVVKSCTHFRNVRLHGLSEYIVGHISLISILLIAVINM